MVPDAELAPQLEGALAGLGLTSTERRAYRFLLDHGPSTPTQVASATRQSRGRIYETLRLLVERGLAREEPSRPIRYLAASPAEAVRVALAHAERQSALLRRAYGSLSRSSPATSPTMPRARPTDLAVVNGRAQVHEEMRRLIEGAQQFIHLEGGARFLQRLLGQSGLVPALEDAVRRRVRVTIHHPANVPPALRAQLGKALGPHVLRQLPPALATSTIACAATETGALYVHAQPDDAAENGRDVGFRAASPAFAADLVLRYEALTATAPAPPTRSDADVPTALTHALQGATNEVLSIDAGMDSPLWGASKAARATLVAARERGVRLRLLVTPEAPSLLDEGRRPWEVRRVPWAPASIVVVDGHQVFQALPPADGTPPVLRETRDPRELRFYLDLFERLWQQATPVS